MATISITNELDVADKYEALDNPIDPNRSAFLEDPSLKTLVGGTNSTATGRQVNG